jgi:hypothetical protein
LIVEFLVKLKASSFNPASLGQTLSLKAELYSNFSSLTGDGKLFKMVGIYENLPERSWMIFEN